MLLDELGGEKDANFFHFALTSRSLRVYLAGCEPVMRISTSLRALCCQSGLEATFETPNQGPE